MQPEKDPELQPFFRTFQIISQDFIDMVQTFVDAAAVIGNEEEDEGQRRERIQAEENGQDLGAALGIVLGLASTLLEDEDPLPQEEGPAFTM